MKTLLWLFLSCLFLCFAVPVAHSDPALEFIQQLPTGIINWTRGSVKATGSSSEIDINHYPDRVREHEDKTDQAFKKATHNLMLTLTRMRMNNRNCVFDILNTEAHVQDKVREMTSGARVVQERPLEQGGVEVTVEMSLFGGFAQLMLPPDIRQVESIKPLISPRTDNYQNAGSDTLAQDSPRTRPNGYTGLLVDARGIEANPSMVPVLLNENGQEVYGPAYVSREFAVQHGMCRYVRGDVPDASAFSQVAPNPLIVKGLRTATDGSCDIIISNADASKLRGTSSHLEFLKRCRVVIILD